MNVQMNTAPVADDLTALLSSLTAIDKGAQETAPAAVEPDFDESSLLADLEAIGEVAPAPAATTIEVTAELEEDLLADIVSEAARTESYQNQQDEAPISTTAASAEPEQVKKARAPKDPNKPKVARTPRSAIGDLPDTAFEITVGAPADKAAVLAATPAQKKVAEKFENLFISLNAAKEPSRYVVTAFKLLNAQKSVTSMDIVGAYKTEGLGDGTARSQSGQIMALFDVVGIADRAGSKLTLRADSAVAAKLRAVLGL